MRGRRVATLSSTPPLIAHLSATGESVIIAFVPTERDPSMLIKSIATNKPRYRMQILGQRRTSTYLKLEITIAMWSAVTADGRLLITS